MIVRTSVKAGGTDYNHAQSAVVVRSGVKAGAGAQGGQHAQAVVVVKTGVKAGGTSWGTNHNEALVRPTPIDPTTN